MTSGTSYYGAPGFSPDGRWIAFALGPNPDETNIFKMPVAGGEPSATHIFRACHDYQPSLVTGRPAHRFYLRSKRHAESLDNQRQWRHPRTAGKHECFGHQLRTCLVAGQRHCLPTIGTSKSSADQTIRHTRKSPSSDTTNLRLFCVQTSILTGRQEDSGLLESKGKGLWIISLEPYSETLLPFGDSFPFGWSPDGKYVYAIREYRNILGTRNY